MLFSSTINSYLFVRFTRIIDLKIQRRNNPNSNGTLSFTVHSWKHKHRHQQPTYRIRQIRFCFISFFSFVFLFFWLNWNENRISPSSRNNNKATRKDAPSACICTISTVFIVIIIIFSIVYVLRWCVLFRDVLRSTCICVCTLAVHFVFRLMREKSQINYR